jgi:hypothetical protein
MICEGPAMDGSFYADGVVETEEGTLFTVSDKLDSYHNTRTRSYQLSEEIRSLTCYSLLKAGLHDRPLSLYVTLPVEHYYLAASDSPDSQDRTNQKVIAKKKENLLRGVAFKSPENQEKSIQINDVKVVPESVPLVMDVAYNDHLELDERFKRPLNVVTIDIGANTNDLVYMSVDLENGICQPLSFATRNHSYYELLDKLDFFLKSEGEIKAPHISHKVLRAITRGEVIFCQLRTLRRSRGPTRRQSIS